MHNEKTVRIQIPSSVHSQIETAINSGEFPDWFYPVTLDETLGDYVEARQGDFGGVGFRVFPEETTSSVHYSNPVKTPPEPLRSEIESHRQSVFRESYTLRLEFDDTDWSTVTDAWVEAYFVIEEPTDL